jgi:hypothetical protein
MSEVLNLDAVTPEMCAAELMAKAAHESGLPTPWEKFKDLFPETAAWQVERQRAALRAFAEMEPTNFMIASSVLSSGGTADVHGCVAASKAYAAAAATEEGHPK